MEGSTMLKQTRETKVLVLYTGGTIGMKKTDGGYQPKSGHLQSQIKRLPMLYDVEYAKIEPKESVTSFGTSALEELAMP
ncbi:L-asparaginase-like [Stylophora pistillata]|uniref:L-asparaginase-like n=1 Tax=Stylophora pistillata TaxID=50429 RepID=UPI000C03917B|nr:L-asparaginase-like [Stylophora pistillata]